MSLFKKIFGKINQGLKRTKTLVLEPMNRLLGLSCLNEDQLEKIEELLIEADIGITVTIQLINKLRSESKKFSAINPKNILKDELLKIICHTKSNKFESNGTQVILVIGVNGVGKTTTIGKMAAHLKAKSNDVLVAAGDTFRAAAVEQLEQWCNRAAVRLISNKMGGDPAAVAYDGAVSALANKFSWLIVDTAGRLHTKDHLMRELEKIKRSLQKVIPSAPHRIMLVLDATTGQNGLSQAKAFKKVIGVTDIILTKLDGTAKGGIVIAVLEQLGIPIAFVGVGENIDDLVPFDAEIFVNELLDI